MSAPPYPSPQPLPQPPSPSMLENGSIKGHLLNENVLSTLHRGCERQNEYTLIYFLTPVTKVVGVGTAEGEENRER